MAFLYISGQLQLKLDLAQKKSLNGQVIFSSLCLTFTFFGTLFSSSHILSDLFFLPRTGIRHRPSYSLHSTDSATSSAAPTLIIFIDLDKILHALDLTSATATTHLQIFCLSHCIGILWAHS